MEHTSVSYVQFKHSTSVNISPAEKQPKQSDNFFSWNIWLFKVDEGVDAANKFNLIGFANGASIGKESSVKGWIRGGLAWLHLWQVTTLKFY